MNYKKFNKEFKNNFDCWQFKNKHNERFTIILTHTKPQAWYITGDELDWQIISLFNPEFNIYTNLELHDILDGMKILLNAPRADQESFAPVTEPV